MCLLYFFAFCWFFLLAASSVASSGGTDQTPSSPFKFPCPLKWISTEELPVQQGETAETLLTSPYNLVSLGQLIPSIDWEHNKNYQFWGKMGISSNPTLIPLTFSPELQSFVRALSNGAHEEIKYPFELLTNPNNCSLKLISLHESPSIKTAFLTQLSPSTSSYLAVLLSVQGLTNIDLYSLALFPSLQSTCSGAKQFQTYLLESSVEKIQLQVKVLELLKAEEKVEKFEIQFQSHDKLINKGGGIKEESIHHSLLVEKTWMSTVGLSAEAEIYLMVEIEVLINLIAYKQPIFSVILHLGFELMLDLFLRHHIREIVSMSVGQTLRVPPHTSVDVCSTVSVKHYNLTILSRVEVSHPFLSKEEIVSVLLRYSERFTNVTQDDDNDNNGKIRATYIQSWRASEPWTASNYVLPFGSLEAKAQGGNPATCDSLRNSIRSFNSEQEVSSFLSHWKNRNI